MEAAKALIDRAVTLCDTPYRLAKLAGVSQGSLSEARAGLRPPSIRLVAEAAAIAGADPREAVLWAEVERQRSEAARRRLATLLGLTWSDRSGAGAKP
jgi:transcriptional regulator with XRE-family HTH domain